MKTFKYKSYSNYLNNYMDNATVSILLLLEQNIYGLHDKVL